MMRRRSPDRAAGAPSVPGWLERLHQLLRPARFRDEEEPGRIERTLVAATAAHRARNWTEAERLFRWVIDQPDARPIDRHAARNILGNVLERTRRVDEAIAVYEANVAEGFTGSYPYERLAAIYRRQGRRDDELRVLGQAVAVVERELARGRSDVRPQLDRLRTALAAARAAVAQPMQDRRSPR